MKILSFMVGAEEQHRETRWQLSNVGTFRVTEILTALLTSHPFVTYAHIAKHEMDLPRDAAIPDHLAETFVMATNALRDSRNDILAMLSEQGCLMVGCDKLGRTALQSGGKVEGFAPFASPTGEAHTRHHVIMGIAGVVADIKAYHNAGLIDVNSKLAAIDHVQQLKQLLLPPMPEQTEPEPEPVNP